MDFSKKGLLIAVTGLLLGFASVVNAVPTLFFDGGLNYTASSGVLDVNAQLNGFEDIAPNPVLSGSSFQLSTLFSGLSAESSTTITVADFIGAGATDLSIIGGDSTVLLEAGLNSLQVRGSNGSDFGVMLAMFTASGGSLVNSFAGSELFALQLNLSTTFANDMFRNDFDGLVSGNLKSVAVSEPRILVLLATGLILISLVVVRRNHHGVN